MTKITPNREQFEQLAEAPDDGPVVMLNLLKFKASASDGSGSGAASYGRYGDAAVKMIEDRGGKRAVGRPRASRSSSAIPPRTGTQVLLVRVPEPQGVHRHGDDARVQRSPQAPRERAGAHRRRGVRPRRRPDRSALMGRKILFITTDQQRYDSLGLQRRRRSPARRWSTSSPPTGINYKRAYNQNTVCMPARSTMLTGQYVRTHGVVANGVPLPVDAPSVAAHLAEHGGLPHRAARQGALRARLRPRAPVAGERASPSDGLDRPDAGLRARRAGDARARGPRPRASSTTASGCARAPPERDEGFAALLLGRGRRRHRRARDRDQPDPARLVPHRLGRRPHDRVPRLARRRRRLVRVDELPRPAPPVGPAGVGAAAGATGATSTFRPAIPARPTRSATCSPQKPRALARLATRGRGATSRAGPARVRARGRSPTTRSARSTR